MLAWKGFWNTDMSNRAWIVKEYCHLVNENICFIQEHFEGIVPAGRPNEDIYRETRRVNEQLHTLVEQERDVNRILGAYLKYASEYFEKQEPWNTLETDRKACRNAVWNTLQMIANLTVWLDVLGEPSACPVLQWLELDTAWKVHSVHSGLDISGAKMLVVPVISYGA